MVGWLKKEFIECPKCRSPRVDVPWSLPRGRERRFWGSVLPLLLFGSVMLGGLALGLQRLWLGWAAAGCAAFAALLAVGYRRSLTIYLCVDCRHRWRGRTPSRPD